MRNLRNGWTEGDLFLTLLRGVTLAKSEKAAEAVTEPSEEGVYDADDFLSKDLSNLPEPPMISGRWRVQFINGFITKGVSDKGPWNKVTLLFRPVVPLVENDLTAEQLDDLPSARTELFVNTNAQQRRFVDIAAKFNTEPGLPAAMLADMKGEEALATIKQAVNYRGELEYQASAFKELPVEYEEAA